MSTTPATTPIAHRGATYWFVKLDLALEEGDWVEAARAAVELRTLGIDIRLSLNRMEVCETEVTANA